MSRLDTGPDHELLVRVLRSPEILASLVPEEVSRTMDTAQDARLLGWFVNQAERLDLVSRAPAWLADRITSARALVTEYDRAVRWEIDRLRRALDPEGVPWVLLKGAAYLTASLAAGRGRRVADIDILVPAAELGRTERLLNAHGWSAGEVDAYDDRYYREWMHELPPMTHEARGSVVDVHHALLPRTGRLQPSPARLIDRAVMTNGARVLCPAHMVLHAAAHLFHDGEIAGAIRDLVDLDGLLRAYGADPAFWPDLAREAEALDLRRPAYYAIRYAARFFGTPIPDDVQQRIRAWGPPPAVRRTMDTFVTRALPGPAGHASSTAAFALYVRSHWLRMPPLQLARHLTRKAFRDRVSHEP
ncbi:MAG: nucleotidyltransferase family protein [Acidobacteria bacterium]|nr:nucleotidyltransferase family protein [Acidobacteriota bacterium]